MSSVQARQQSGESKQVLTYILSTSSPGYPGMDGWMDGMDDDDDDLGIGTTEQPTEQLDQ